MPTELFTSKATYPNNIVIPPVTLRHPAYYNSQASTHRADYNMSGQAASATTSSTIEVTTAADLAKLRTEGKPLTSQELKELNARIKAFEEMARIEDRLRLLENRKRQHDSEASENHHLDHPIDHPNDHPIDHPNVTRATFSPRETRPNTLASTEYSESKTSTTSNLDHHRHK